MGGGGGGGQAGAHLEGVGVNGPEPLAVPVYVALHGRLREADGLGVALGLAVETEMVTDGEAVGDRVAVPCGVPEGLCVLEALGEPVWLGLPLHEPAGAGAGDGYTKGELVVSRPQSETQREYFGGVGGGGGET